MTQTDAMAGGEPAEPKLALPARREPAGAGWTWISRGWKLFARAPLMWILAILVWFVIAILVNLVPIVGGLVFQVLNAAIAAGFVVACRSLERGGDFELEHLFAGFREHFGSLLVVGLLLVAGTIAIFLVFAMFVGFSVLGALMTGDAEAIAQGLMAQAMTIALAGLVAAALSIPLMAAFWFAPALVAMHGMGPVQAMKESFVGCMRNWIPFLVWGIVMTIFAIVAAIPLALGYLVWIPVAIASSYAAYRAIFTEDAPGAAA
ncbi:MAG TPA: BPSS1780 family membrane protein [Usitatibacter sp.]|nr:BPSS1780 family membrane protein [Usitatibacter sp.]